MSIVNVIHSLLSLNSSDHSVSKLRRLEDDMLCYTILGFDSGGKKKRCLIQHSVGVLAEHGETGSCL